MLIEFSDTKIEDNSRGFKLQKANFDMEVNTAVSLDLTKKYWLSLHWTLKAFFNAEEWACPLEKIFLQKAEAQLAYELQAAKIQQRIRQEEIQIQVSDTFWLKTGDNAYIQGGGEEKADWNWGAGDQEEGEGVDCHGKVEFTSKILNLIALDKGYSSCKAWSFRSSRIILEWEGKYMIWKVYWLREWDIAL